MHMQKNGRFMRPFFYQQVGVVVLKLFWSKMR